jgi:hypothetical protein
LELIDVLLKFLGVLGVELSEELIDFHLFVADMHFEVIALFRDEFDFFLEGVELEALLFDHKLILLYFGVLLLVYLPVVLSLLLGELQLTLNAK